MRAKDVGLFVVLLAGIALILNGCEKDREKDSTDVDSVEETTTKMTTTSYSSSSSGEKSVDITTSTAPTMAMTSSSHSSSAASHSSSGENSVDITATTAPTMAKTTTLTTTLHGISLSAKSLVDFLIDDVCIAHDGAPVDIDPYTCQADGYSLRDMLLDEPIRMYRHDRGNWQATCSVPIRLDSNRVGVLTPFDFGGATGQSFLEFDSHPGFSSRNSSGSIDGYNIVEHDGEVASYIATSDPTGSHPWWTWADFQSKECKADDAWLLFPLQNLTCAGCTSVLGVLEQCLLRNAWRPWSSVESMSTSDMRNTVIVELNNAGYGNVSYLQAMSNEELASECPNPGEPDLGALMARLRGGNQCPADWLGHSFTPYRLKNFIYTSGKTMESLISDHFGGQYKATADHMERFYHTRAYGLTRWERWEHGNQSESWWSQYAPRSSWACNGELYDKELNMTRYDCRDWSWTSFIPNDGYEPRAWTIASNIGFGNQLVNHGFGAIASAVSACEGNSCNLDALRSCLVRNGWRDASTAQSMTSDDVRNTVIVGLSNIAMVGDISFLQSLNNGALALKCPKVNVPDLDDGLQVDLDAWQSTSLNVTFHTNYQHDSLLYNNHYVCLTQEQHEQQQSHDVQTHQFYQDVPVSRLPAGVTKLGFGVRSWAQVGVAVGVSQESGWEVSLQQFDETGEEVAHTSTQIPVKEAHLRTNASTELSSRTHLMRFAMNLTAHSWTGYVCIDDAWLTPM